MGRACCPATVLESVSGRSGRLPFTPLRAGERVTSTDLEIVIARKITQRERPRTTIIEHPVKTVAIRHRGDHMLSWKYRREHVTKSRSIPQFAQPTLNHPRVGHAVAYNDTVDVLDRWPGHWAIVVVDKVQLDRTRHRHEFSGNWRRCCSCARGRCRSGDAGATARNDAGQKRKQQSEISMSRNAAHGAHCRPHPATAGGSSTCRAPS